jgi:catechol 2,3-dioxygenase-like lactoylglutathione lyase family enzyme
MGAAAVKRLGHVVVRVSDFVRSEQWYKSRFGFLTSDEVVVGEEERPLTAFMRCDRGDVHVDHHTFLCVGVGEVGFDHAAFEVEDFDAVMAGHEKLKAGEWEHQMGVGRHFLGSQVYDYWRDPWGHTVEHFTDGDLLDASVAPNKTGPAEALGSQWGSLGPLPI